MRRNRRLGVGEGSRERGMGERSAVRRCRLVGCGGFRCRPSADPACRALQKVGGIGLCLRRETGQGGDDPSDLREKQAEQFARQSGIGEGLRLKKGKIDGVRRFSARIVSYELVIEALVQLQVVLVLLRERPRRAGPYGEGFVNDVW